MFHIFSLDVREPPLQFLTKRVPWGAAAATAVFQARGGTPPRSSSCSKSRGRVPPPLLQWARGEYPSATTAAAACSAAGGRYPPAQQQ